MGCLNLGPRYKGGLFLPKSPTYKLKLETEIPELSTRSFRSATMAAAAAITARSAARSTRRFMSSTASSSHHKSHQSTHQYTKPDSYIGSWETPKNPEEAKAKLALLRREYDKKVKDVRKEYIKEMETMRLEKQRKDAAKKEALRLQTEERKKLKAEAAKVRAEERKIAQEEFRQMLLKERAEKLEHWRMKERRREEKKKEKGEGLRRQSSLWVDENELESKILDVVCMGNMTNALPTRQNSPTGFRNQRP